LALCSNRQLTNFDSQGGLVPAGLTLRVYYIRLNTDMYVCMWHMCVYTYTYNIYVFIYKCIHTHIILDKFTQLPFYCMRTCQNAVCGMKDEGP